jgi:ubiquinone/menaquinone biosynthesis C-methylase UbiE
MRICWLACVFLTALTGTAMSRTLEEQGAYTWADIFKAMAIGPGSNAADVGAGIGSATFPMAELVGANGRVWAVDIDEKHAIVQLRNRIEKDGITNVEVTVGTIDNPKLPVATMNAALIMNAYHEMERHREMLAGVLVSLKPGGRLVVIESIPRKGHGRTRAEQAKHHVLAAQFVETELKAAGFSILRRQDQIDVEGYRKSSLWMIVAGRQGD